MEDTPNEKLGDAQESGERAKGACRPTLSNKKIVLDVIKFVAQRSTVPVTHKDIRMVTDANEAKRPLPNM
jgi:hypothetical protein